MRHLSLLWIALSLAACAGGGGTGSSASPATGAAIAGAGSGSPAPSSPQERWWKGDLHVHTLYSRDGTDTVAQTKAMARHQGLDFIVLSDHDTVRQATDPDAVSDPDVTVVGGCEWTEVAHAGIVGARTVPPALTRGAPTAWTQEIQAAFDHAHAEGAAVVLNHPTWAMFPWVLPAHGADAVEIWNSFFTLSPIGLHPTSARRLQERLRQKGLDTAGVPASDEIREAVRHTGSSNDQAIAFWEALLDRGHRMAAVGGSDRHRYVLPGYPTTWVRATENRPDRLAEAIRESRTIVTAGPRGPMVDLVADADGDGAFEAAIGDVVAAGRPVAFRARVVGAADGTLRIVRRGRILHEVALRRADQTFTFTEIPSAGDWYRVDVLVPVDWSLPFAAQGLALVANPNPASLSFLFSAIGVSVSIAANAPLVDFDDGYLRLVSVDIGDPTMARAAITSPIYAR